MTSTVHPDARLFLLSKFLSPTKVEAFDESEWMEAILGEKPATVIQRFEHDSLIEEPSLAELAKSTIKVPDLKRLLREQRQSLSGRKSDLIERLIANGAARLRLVIGATTLRRCSTRGAKLASDFLDREKERRRLAEEATIDLVRKRDFRRASIVVAEFEKGRVDPRGFLDWSRHDPNYDVSVLERIFESSPAILNKLDSTKLPPLRLAAALDHLWGTNTPLKWLGSEFETGVNLGAEAASRAFLSGGIHRAKIDQAKAFGIHLRAEVITTYDGRTCAACRALDGIVFSLDELPEIPYEHCTSDDGCRCTTAFITTDLD